MDEILFYAFGAVALGAALLSVTRKNAVAAACWLVVMFFGLAGVFVLLEAYFVAAIQILVYAGAIMVLFLFVIMLLDMRREELLAHGGPRFKAAGVALSAVFLGVVGWVLVSARDGEGVAERVTATLRLPAPPASATADPLKIPATPVAPPPRTVLLAEAKPSDVAMDAATRAWFSKEHARARIGSVRTPGLDGEDRERGLLASVGSDGAVHAWLDADGDRAFADAEALVLVSPAAERGASPDRQSFEAAVPGAAPGTILDVVLTRRGLLAAADGGPDGSPFAIGKSLFDEWIMPFEVTSVLLLGAIFGAVVLTKRRLA